MSFTSRVIKKITICLIILSVAGCGFSRDDPEKENRETYPSSEGYPELEIQISYIDRQGDLILDTSVQKLNEKGYEAGDVITVRINEKDYTMPIGLMINETEDTICLFENEKAGKDIVKLALKNGSLCSDAGLGEIKATNDDPGYRILWNDDLDQTLPVFLKMEEKQGHNDDYPADGHLYERTGKREDYPHLSDAEFANFREVETAGMGNDILYRSSSPVNPKLNRNLECDKALKEAKIRTVFNMADYENGPRLYEGYDDSYYKNCDVIALNMSTWFNSEEFGKRLATGLRFMIAHEGPYLIHCTEGKDRTGFAIAIIECLMGAQADEVVSDYMKTYYNYYGIKLGSLVYNSLASRNIKKDLAKAFAIGSIYGEDLSVCAHNYLKKIGMSEDEIKRLKEILGQ